MNKTLVALAILCLSVSWSHDNQSSVVPKLESVKTEVIAKEEHLHEDVKKDEIAKKVEKMIHEEKSKDHQTDADAVTEQDLQHHNYLLTSINGKAFATPDNAMSPNIEFGENMHVSGSMCNNFFGQGQLKDGVLTATGVGMTRKFCADDTLNTLDHLISQLLEKGAKVILQNNGQKLILSDNTTVLEFKLKDYVH